ncbi:sensor histidine kinase [Paenibacillus ginsengarvi]|uniref:histidine kinase n=1 Tax=Paenibacillus ginsengarvi TaxID=400777 RepID=A0A3B0B1Z4_9BACL|nr:ATP-binding protein [Paenibacillus ginsengarvi]RKN66038.1 HAMP domain-containing protein [Paenibacillus ginsengarvi]
MKLNRKLFLAMASFIMAMCVLYGLLTQWIVREGVNAAVDSNRGEMVASLSDTLVAYYAEQGRTWDGIGQVSFGESLEDAERQKGLLLQSAHHQTLLHRGTPSEALIQRLGIRRSLEWEGETIGLLYYYDPDVAMLSKLRIGLPISVLTLLIPGAALFIAISLVVAWRLSRRLTEPLRRLMAVIERLGKGEFGVQAQVISRDEFGQVAIAFNTMSRLLQEGETQRRQWVADVAHELRTPITVIRGQLDLAQHRNKPIDPENLLPLQDELIRLTRLVDDLHQLSLAEAGQLPLDRKPTDLGKLLGRIVERLTHEAEQKGIRMTLVCRADSPDLLADANRLTQVFLNLTVNALRYTPPNGQIELAIQEERTGEGESGGIRVIVSDTGQGIEPQHLPHIFDRFYRTDEARSRSGGGAGLGLAIAKGLVVAHGGTIEVTSAVGQGTSFIVRLPRS